jgi:hypothetical protein
MVQIKNLSTDSSSEFVSEKLGDDVLSRATDNSNKFVLGKLGDDVLSRLCGGYDVPAWVGRPARTAVGSIRL